MSDAWERPPRMLKARYRRFILWSAGRFMNECGLTLERQLRWLSAEVGEAHEKLLLKEGANPRKAREGQTATSRDIANELGDVICNALLGIALTGEDIDEVLGKQMEKAMRRWREWDAGE
jgi:NTP pyrophosphatase (non-canonical NTP hydrolase)